MPHLTTDATARDLDILRSALEEPELTYFGYSYGGGLGAAYAQLYPSKVRRMVLDALAAGAGGGPEIGNPENVSGGKLTDALAAAGISQLLYTTDDWPRLRRALADGLEGDGQALYDAAMEFEESEGFSRDAFTAIDCNDTSTRPRTERIAEAAEIARERAPILGAWQAWSWLRCTGWDTVSGDAWLADPTRQIAAIMVVGTVGDSVVPYENVKDLRSTLSGSVMVTLKGRSHTAYRTGDRCVNEAVDAYLLDGVIPTADVECPAAGTRRR
ncbi:alpha/beta hydrolase [Nonomuraea sp. NPDC005650]|uniref:alpha/beta hydrolase n=1 Tax=Nonomuraea sp. NPDC005650 TaxID=3157045 RepID=UPI0033B33A6D